MDNNKKYLMITNKQMSSTPQTQKFTNIDNIEATSIYAPNCQIVNVNRPKMEHPYDDHVKKSNIAPFRELVDKQKKLTTETIVHINLKSMM